MSCHDVRNKTLPKCCTAAFQSALTAPRRSSYIIIIDEGEYVVRVKPIAVADVGVRSLTESSN